jgi:hypothetical protein
MQALRATCKRLREYPSIFQVAGGECANSDDGMMFLTRIASDAVGFSLES